MATTMYFEKAVQSKAALPDVMQIEFGKSTFCDGEPLIYLNVNGKGVIMDENTGREFCESVAGLAHYLGYSVSS